MGLFSLKRGMWEVRYLSEEQIKGFDQYKYSCMDTSPVAVYISNPMWNQLVKVCPLWIAPNVLTLAGFVLSLSTLALMAYYDYDFYATAVDYATIPSWVWLFCSVATELAHVLDGIDGKQARRVGASGPTGELFDHGFDSWATVPFTVTLLSLFGRDHPFSKSAQTYLYILISVQLVFFFTHWEKYNTGTLYLSWGYDVSQYGLCACYLVTYFFGANFWQFFVWPSYGFRFCDVLEATFYGSCLGSLAVSCYNVYCSYENKTGRQCSWNEIVLPIYPLVVLLASSVLWAAYSPQGLIHLDPRLFLWTMGVVFSNISCRLIVAQMTSTRCDVFNALLLVYCVAAALCLLGVLGPLELPALMLTGLVVTLAHIHYGVCVVRQLCDHFNIYAFMLGKRRSQDS